MTPLLQQLIDSVLDDPDSFDALRNQYREQLTPQLADEARTAYQEAMRAQQGSRALGAAMVASTLYLTVGDRYRGLRCYIDAQQVRFMLADSQEVYQDIRSECTKLVSMADQIAALDLGFDAATIAANCCYFTARLHDDAEQQALWLRQTLDDLNLAAAYGPQGAKGAWLYQYVSLLSAFIEEFTTLVPTPNVAQERQLRQLAQSVEEFVPVGYSVEGDPERSAAFAKRLALLSYRFGSREVAQQRLARAGGE
jgi:hypothetical protein